MTLLAGTAAAADDAEFAFNLFSDIAPVIALFGDQFARQFMSESLTWVDHVVFAMVPLGILTAITAAIRVQGSPVAKAFIGRARENKALAEIELMSSTSGEVCELFNGNSIVRAMGKPAITEFLIFPEKYEDSERKYADNLGGTEPTNYESWGIESFQSASSGTSLGGLNNVWNQFLKSIFQILYVTRGLFIVFQKLHYSWSSKEPNQTGSDVESGNMPLSALPNETTADSNINTKEEKKTKEERKTKEEKTTAGEADMPQPPEGSSNLQLNLSSDYSDHSGPTKGQEIALAAIFGVILQLGLVKLTVSQKVWRLLTLGAAGSAGIGFVAQFMGLRGLAFPCSIAQLGAIILMALIRARIRRRLGRLPVNSIALAGYELDFLATHITFSRDFRRFEWRKMKNVKPFGKERRQTEFCRWSINTPGSKTQDVLLDRSKDSVDVSSPEGIHADSIGNSGTATLGHHEPEASIHARTPLPSSQQLLRVRERLGNLCKWKSKSSESARALAQSIEHFMDTFSRNMRDGNKGQLRALNWEIKATRGSEEGKPMQEDCIKISVKRGSQGKWKADLGKIDAALSLWMADVEAKRLDKEQAAKEQTDKEKTGKEQAGKEQAGKEQADTDKEKDPSEDWRRTQSGNDMACRYGRLVGNNLKGGVLKRDISWWIDGIIADQCDPKVRDTSKDTRYQKTQHWSEDVDLVIGKKVEPENVDTFEFGINSTGRLPCILAQHLFTDFIWTAVKGSSKGLLQRDIDGIRQVEIEGVHMFDSQSFAQTWLRPRLRHRQLSKAIRQMETYGLGTMNEILLCIIPAFSHMGLLPNQEILKLMPRIRYGHEWVEVAMCHTTLLQRIKEPSNKEVERLTADAIISTINFVLLAYEPYDENTKPSQELSSELKEIVAKLVSPALSIVMEKIIPFYHLQHRCEAIVRVFRQFSELQGMEKTLAPLEVQEKRLNNYISEDGGNEFLDEYFAIETLDFSKQHFDLVSPLKRDKVCHNVILGLFTSGLTVLSTVAESDHAKGFRERKRFACQNLLPDNIKSLTSVSGDSAQLKRLDVFGWSALHYGSIARDRCPSHSFYIASLISEDKSERLLDLQDAFDRNIMHTATAVLDKNRFMFYDLLVCQPISSVKHAMYQSGQDGMTPLHLISKAGALHEMNLLREKLGDTIRDLELVLKKDLWHRQALHLACKSGCDEVIVELLKMGARSDQFDDFEKSPVDYFLEARGMKRSLRPGEEQNSEVLTHNDRGNGEGLSKEDRAIFLKFAPKPDTEYQHRKTLLHIAVEIEDGGTIAELCDKHFSINARDQSGRTPLHYALAASKVTMAKSLVEAFGADPAIKDSQGMTPLLLSVSRGLMDMVKLLVCRNHELLEKDSDGDTALHVAITYGHEEIAIYLLDLEKKRDGPFVPKRDSPLIAACRKGLSLVVPKILDKWPELIDEGGLLGQPPISWACENGHGAIVKQLIAHLEDKTDIKPKVLNQQAAGWYNYTPLHFATNSADPKCLDLLLEQDCVDLGLKDENEKTPVQLAIEAEKLDYVHRLLLDKRTSFGERIRYVKELISRPSNDVFSSVVSDILQSVTDANLLDEFLVWLLDKIEEINKKSPLRSLVTNVKEKSWGRFSCPWELVALFNHVGFKKELKSHNADENGFDEDGWSCVDFVKSFNRTGTFKHLLGYLESQRKASSIPPLATPATLVGEQFLHAVDISTCPTEGHTNYAKVHRVRLVKEIDDVEKVCLRSDHCISAGSDSFYFEVKVLTEAPCQWLGIGFCAWDIEEDRMPGWFERSWAYHGDDGLLFVDSGDGDLPSQDFGEQGVFGSNDIVGVCLNMKTGQGFCTKNGKPLDMGGIFPLPDERFNYGKLYPCVGFDVTSEGVGLDFEVNFDGSGQHPFEYKGSFMFDESEAYTEVESREMIGGTLALDCFGKASFVLGLEHHAMFTSVTRQFSISNLASQRENELLLSSLRTELVLPDNESTPNTV
ncbi:serine threonine phosphatase 6 regulatory ankyrin repeat subunit a [Fusarium phyllophilum]|uniref:Serine threonine phosphatase 6 regulatory ankyrin repeat subunit a n=1 Tax=Fusarium phyllophilum TaxID=47803 RepID=A0A8H5NP21_9HYPO|nr:serine threonine phosphatase 6 regulatory ankyrin repeat subunit a [Fusarium phyllophilum]